MPAPVEVTPLLSKAFKYSTATDLRCSSVIVCLLIAMICPSQACAQASLGTACHESVRRSVDKTEHKKHKKDTKGTRNDVASSIFCAFCVPFVPLVLLFFPVGPSAPI